MPASIPVTTDQCESEQDKMLYNIWQWLEFGIFMPIPGIPSARYPLGWDVDSTTNQLLYNIMFNGGGGGGGGGTVTSVGSSSQSLDNNSAPIPIIGAGNISFELQIIDILRADLITAIIGSALLPDVTYRVTDPLMPLDTMLVSAISGNQLNATMSGLIAGEFIRVGWSPFTDTLTELYCPRLNNRVARRATSGRDCIETFDVTNASYTNCEIIECDFDDADGSVLDGLIVDEDSVIQLTGGNTLDGVRCQAGTTITVIDAELYVCSFGQRATVSFIGSGTEIWDGINVLSTEPLILTTGVNNKTFFPSLNEVVLFSPTDGGNDVVPNSLATYIYVNLDPDLLIVSYLFKLPDKPFNGQVIIINSSAQINGVTISGNTHLIQGNDSKFDAYKETAFIFDSATDTYYLV